MIGIVDYGLGNISAFYNVYKKLNIPCFFAQDAVSLKNASKLILPGVGAFDYAMAALNDSGMREALEGAVLGEKIPVLGICVGMQMLADSSEEGNSLGLGWLPGVVKKLDTSNSDRQLPLPHMGWNTVKPTSKCALFDGLGDSPRFYFLHSYYFECKTLAHSLATADYGQKFSCVVGSDNIYGVQCHPEKSHQDGIKLLENFARL